MTALRVPPGRAGRLWLQHRLQVATRGADLLEQKLRILHAEEQRYALLARRTEAEWVRRSTEADTWLLRAELLGHQRGTRLATGQDPVRVDVVWADVMGVRYPERATCQVPTPPPAASAGTATALAAQALSTAVESAAQHAVAARAHRIVQTEEQVTRRRLRAIRDHWIPKLEDSRRQVALGLEEIERGDAARLHWAAARRPRREAGP